MTLRPLQGVIDRLVNDRFNEDEGDDYTRAYKRGHNDVSRSAVTALSTGLDVTPLLAMTSEDIADEIERAYARGKNHGARHLGVVLKSEAALRDLADAPLIATVDLGEER